jgi:hypothetical protein
MDIHIYAMQVTLLPLCLVTGIEENMQLLLRYFSPRT